MNETFSRLSPPAENSSVWFVVPFYNEGPVIGDVVRDIRNTFPNVICVDDGSTDGSAQIAQEAGGLVVTHPINLGQGAALQTGISFACMQPNIKYIVTFDADGQHKLDDVSGMITKAEERNLAFVLGSRFIDQRTQISSLKKLVLKLAVVFTNLTSGLKLTDAHNGLRLLRRDVACRLDLKQNRMAHASEIVTQLGKMNLNWEEYPTEIIYSEYSKAKGQPLLNSVNILVELMME